MDATIVAAVALVAAALIGLSVTPGSATVPAAVLIGAGAGPGRGGGRREGLGAPDLPAAGGVVLASRQGRFRDPGRLTRGPLGLGTDFESIRDYVPDDDFR